MTTERLFSTLMLAFVSYLFGLGTSFAGGEFAVLRGTIVSVEKTMKKTESRYIVLNNGRRIPVASGIPLTIDGEPGTLGEVQVGMTAEIVFIGDKVHAISIGSGNAPAARGPSSATSRFVRDIGLSSSGPRIEIVQPEAGTIKSVPFPLKIKFLTQPEASVDVNSLKFDIIKNGLRISLLDKVRPYATPDGIDLPSMALPDGKFEIEISISDLNGLRTTETQTWTVLH